MPSVVVVGAGAAGLAVGAALRGEGIDPLIVDRSASVGGLWDAGAPNSPSRPDVRLVSSSAHFGFDGMPVKSKDPYPLQGEVLSYLKNFASENLSPENFRLETEVSRISRNADGGWGVQLRYGQIIRSEAVVICTGLYRVPFVPRGENVAAPWTHSRDFNPQQLRPRDRVRVVGAGNSAADVALSASRADAEAWLQWPRVPWLLPSYIEGRPADTIDFDFERVPKRTRGSQVQHQLASRAEEGRMALEALLGAKPVGLPYETATITSDRLVEFLANPASGIRVVGSDDAVPRCDLTVYCTGYARPAGPVGLAPSNIERDPLRIAATSFPGLYFVGDVKTEGGGLNVFSRSAEVVAALIGHQRRGKSHQRLLEALRDWRPDLLWGLRPATGSELVYSEAFFEALARLREMTSV